jgi:signal transduction histidine kinase
MADQSVTTPAPLMETARQNTITQVWRELTRPHVSIQDIETRRQSRLLAGLTLAILITSSIAALIMIARSTGGLPVMVQYLLPAQALTVVMYLLNRNGHYRPSAILFVGLNFILVHLVPALSGDASWLFFATMMLILSAILMPVSITAGLFVVSLILQVAVGIIVPVSTTFTNLGAFMIFLVTASMVLVFMAHRSGLERERQQLLHDANEKLRRSEAELEDRVQQRTQELVLAKEAAEADRHRAEEADRVKSQFLASMSHELRTPLNAILTFNELMALGTFGEVNEEQVDYLQKSLQSGRHLLSLINDVLDITKIQAGMLKLFMEEDFDVAVELESIAVSADKLLLGKSVKLITDIDQDIPHLICDKRRLRQVLLNLVSNAVKFTEEGTITLSAKKREQSVLFAVLDTGPGIEEDQQKLIFEPFVQTETGIKHAGGTGLGLPISKRLVEGHGGRLWAESAPGQGAAFYVEIPATPVVRLGEKEIRE